MNLFSRLKNMKILLIDDDEWIRDSMQLFFEGEGCHLLAIGTAEEGLKILGTQEYDIIIADYRLPDMDGLDFFKRIKETHPNSIKILITAFGSKDLFSKAMKTGIHDFIEKPFTSETIENSLSRLVKDSSATEE